MPAFLFIGVEGSAGQYMWAPGIDPIPFTNTADRDALLKAAKIDPTDGATISPEMFGRLR